MANVTVLSDFDGTIVNVDTGSVALSKFASSDWEAIEEQFANGHISFEESLTRQFSMITAPEQSILRQMEGKAVVRPHFRELVSYCKRTGISFIITSGGLDFLIRDVMATNNLSDFVQIYAPKAQCHPGGIKLVFPKLHNLASFTFKDDLVGYFQEQGRTVVYVGDGQADYYAIKKADIPFAMKGSPSANRCRAEGIRFTEILDFGPVLRVVKKMLPV